MTGEETDAKTVETAKASKAEGRTHLERLRDEAEALSAAGEAATSCSAVSSTWEGGYMRLEKQQFTGIVIHDGNLTKGIIVHGANKLDKGKSHRGK